MHPHSVCSGPLSKKISPVLSYAFVLLWRLHVGDQKRIRHRQQLGIFHCFAMVWGAGGKAGCHVALSGLLPELEVITTMSGNILKDPGRPKGNTQFPRILEKK